MTSRNAASSENDDVAPHPAPTAKPGLELHTDGAQGAGNGHPERGKPDESPVLFIDLLGQFCLRAGGAELVGDAWRSRKARSLIELLALEPGHALHRERLYDLLWPSFEPGAAANNLRQTLYQARAALQPLSLPPGSFLCHSGERLSLYRPKLIVTDVETFETAAAKARRGCDPDTYWQAIDRYRGPLLHDVLYEDWAQLRRETLASLYAGLLGDVARLHLSRGEDTRALDALQRLIASEPTDETAVRQYMRLTVAAGNRSAALKQYRALEQALARELDVEPEAATRKLYLAIKAGRLPSASSFDDRDVSPAPARPPQSNLPASLSAFIGREREVAELASLIAQHRLVTLTGPGGIGKTRLAVEVARQWLTEHREEVWLVELAAVSDPTMLPQAIGSVLGISTEGPGSAVEELARALRDRHALLVLDNCEHLLPECATHVTALLAGASHLRILATSRIVLGLDGGQRWPVPALELPHGEAPLSELAGNDAVRLFVDRMLWRLPAFALTGENTRQIAAICRQLDGVPLALELAAAKTSVLTISQLAARLDDALALLNGGSRNAPDRQQTLRATLDWSYALLDGPEQTLFRRVAVFCGGWALEAAEAVCACGEITAPSVLDLLEQLIEKSQVQVDRFDGAARYRLLEPVRQYALEHLETSGESATLHSRHAAYMLAFIEAIEPGLNGPGLAALLGPLDRERANLRAALSWALEQHDAATILRLASILARYWGVRWQSAEGLGWLEAGLALPGAGRTALRACAARRAGELARQLVEFDRARAWYQESLEISRDVGDDAGIGWALVLLADVLEEAGDWDGVRGYAGESLALFREVGDELGIARALNMQAEVARFEGDYSRAECLYRQSLAYNQAAGDHVRIAIQHHNLGYVALAGGDTMQAARLFRQSYLISEATGSCGWGPLSFLEGMGATASASSRPVEATRLYAAFSAACASPGTEFKLHPVDQSEYDRYLARARAATGEAAFARNWAQGACLSQEQAVAEARALADELAGDRRPRSAAGIDLLTSREREVANLVADRFTNHQIAQQLGLSERTIDTHVSHILRKLQLSTRAQIGECLHSGEPT